MHAQRTLELEKIGLNIDEVEDLNALSQTQKDVVFTNLKAYANSKLHGFYKCEIPVELALKALYDSMHGIHNHCGYHTSSFVMVVFDFASVFQNMYPAVPIQQVEATWEVPPNSQAYINIRCLQNTLSRCIELIGNAPRLANIAAKAHNVFREEGNNVTASKLILRFDDACTI